MDNILHGIKKKAKILKRILLGYAFIIFAMASVLLYFYFH
jgi:hypothetical protein